MAEFAGRGLQRSDQLKYGVGPVGPTLFCERSIEFLHSPGRNAHAVRRDTALISRCAVPAAMMLSCI